MEVEKKDSDGKPYMKKEFVYRPENLEKQLEALDNMDEDFRRCAINKLCDYTDKHIFEFMEDEKCFGDELKKKIGQKRFMELYYVYEFKCEVFDLVFDKGNLVNFNDYDIDVLQKIYNNGCSNSECERLLDGHKLFILNNNQKTILQRLGVNIFIDNNTDVEKEISQAKNMNERIREITRGESFGLSYILSFFGVRDDDEQEILAQKFEAIFNDLKIKNIDIKLYSIFKLYKFLVPKFVEYFITHRKDNENKSSLDFFNDTFDDIKKEIIDYAKPYSDLVKKFYSKDADGKYNTKNQLEMLNTMDLNSKQLLNSDDLCVANEFNLEVQKKLFDDDVFLYGEFPNLSKEMQIYVLENLTPRKKHKLKLAFEKNYMLFFNCSREVKEKLCELGFDIYFNCEVDEKIEKQFCNSRNKLIDLYKKLANEKYLDDVPAGYCWAEAALKSFDVVSNFENSESKAVLDDFISEVKNKYKDEDKKKKIGFWGLAKYSLSELSKKFNKRSFYFQLNGNIFSVISYDANSGGDNVSNNYLDMINDILDGSPVCFSVHWPLISDWPDGANSNHLCALKQDKKIRIDFAQAVTKFAYFQVAMDFRIFSDDTNFIDKDGCVSLIDESLKILFGSCVNYEELERKLNKTFENVESKFKPYGFLELYKFIFDEFTRIYIDENNVNKNLSPNDFLSVVLERLEKKCHVKQNWVKKKEEQGDIKPENKKPEDVEIKKDKIGNGPFSDKPRQPDKKKNNLEQIKKFALVIASVLGNQKTCEIINKLTDDELNNFYNENKNMLEKIKAELCKKENLERLGLKKEDFLSNGFKLDDEKVNDISRKFNITYKDKLWFAGLGTGPAVSVALGISMFFLELPVLAISSGTLAIGFLVGLIYKLVKQMKINTGQKKFFENIGIDENDFSKPFGKLADLQKSKVNRSL